VAVLAVAIALVFVTSPGARVFAHTFLSPHYMRIALFGDPTHNITPMWQAFVKNVLLCVVAEPLVLLLALPVALLRNSRSPLLAGPRIALTAYVDFARGVPLILIVLAVYFGFPILGIPFVSTRTWFQYGLFCLVFCYAAYVSEVYRAGVQSVPFAQTLAGRAIGLSESQLLRFVTIPQALRIVVAPLINDFVSLQKDTAIIGIGAGVIELLKAAQINQGVFFNDSSYAIAGLLFLSICVPLTRLADSLQARDMRARLAGAT
jgi:polar amino acid transport system permease protein